MEFDFPEPYDLEVPRRIGEARQQLSPEGEEVLERILAQEGNPEDVGRALVALPTLEGRVLLGISNLITEACNAHLQETQGWIDLHNQMQSIIRRAQELDPEFAALGGEATTGEAIAILKHHGEAPGVSDEVLEMIVEVPREE
jgi:hypothetical protein